MAASCWHANASLQRMRSGTQRAALLLWKPNTVLGHGCHVLTHGYLLCRR